MYATAPRILLFKGVILKFIELVSASNPLFILLIVNLILLSASTPVAGTFTVL